MKLNTRSLHFLIRYMVCIKSLFIHTPPLAPWIRTVSPALAFSLQETNSKHHMGSSNKLKRGEASFIFNCQQYKHCFTKKQWPSLQLEKYSSNRNNLMPLWIKINAKLYSYHSEDPQITLKLHSF